MKKEVLVSVSGVQSDLNPDDKVEILLPGQYYKKNRAHYIMYEQYDEASGEVLKNTIKVKDFSVELKKTGYTNVRMYFEKDRNTTSYYDMPQGSMLIETRTGNVQVLEEEDSMLVNINYDLYINEQYITECAVTIKVVERMNQRAG